MINLPGLHPIVSPPPPSPPLTTQAPEPEQQHTRNGEDDAVSDKGIETPSIEENGGENAAPDSLTNNECKEAPTEPLYGGYTRFELELEFITLLSSPLYLNHLASPKLLQDPAFVAYLRYLNEYWRRPEYIKYLAYPGPTLKALELLQEERFRKEVLSPEVVGMLGARWAEGRVE